ncbi:RDD family protein [Sediminicola luteus]|uniref:RDD domain-containing protein n=1 Tax=Sediminicola luteus TaxID=319238 RepID=A0A2A4G4T5_9FLAO|nr:hypothetical protein [Sediminicola luteus]PCE62735.1 hypothetical protein B7P33_15705 [Sediminicola luteus]
MSFHDVFITEKNKVRFTFVFSLFFTITGSINGGLDFLRTMQFLTDNTYTLIGKDTLQMIRRNMNYFSLPELGSNLHQWFFRQIGINGELWNIVLNVNIVNLVCIVLFGVGLFRYVKTHGEKAGLLLFFFSVYFVVLIFHLAAFPFRGLIFDQILSEISAPPRDYPVFTIRMFGYLLTSMFQAFVIYRILKTHKPQKHLFIKGLLLKYNLRKSVRILHYIVDGLACFVLVFWPLWPSLIKPMATMSIFKWLPWNEVELPIAIILFKILFFAICEGVFNRSPSKYLTNTYVTVIGKEKNNVANLLRRSFIRAIPFDALSFLWNDNWHDKISSTVVVKESYVAEEVNDRNYGVSRVWKP